MTETRNHVDYDSAGFFSRISYSWLNGLIRRLNSEKLGTEDLRLPVEFDADQCHDDFMRAWKAHLQEVQHGEPSLLKAVFKCYWPTILLTSALKLCWGAFLLMACFYFVITLVSNVNDSDESDVPNTKANGYILSAGLFVCCFLLSLSQQLVHRFSQQCGWKLRAALMTAVYRKALRLEKAAEMAPDVLNLLSSDCGRLMEAFAAFQYVWSSPLEAMAIIGLMFLLIGEWAVYALVMTVVLLFVQYWIARRIAALRAHTIETTDLRVRVVTELIAAMKLVKLYSWEQQFFDKVRALRESETAAIFSGNHYKAWNLMLVFAIPPMIALVLFSLYADAKDKLPPEIAFTTLSLFNSLRFPLVVMPKAVKNIAEAVEAARRVSDFLLTKETSTETAIAKLEEALNTTRAARARGASIAFTKADEDEQDDVVMQDIDFTVKIGQKAAVVGPLGSGKTSILMALLGEARVPQGQLLMGGTVAYVPQEPWIHAGTIRSNILFGKDFDEDRYKRTVFACALEQDFNILPDGDQTMLAEGGINLSGGQRQRICLARAVYSDAETFLLDNPLSAVDWQTGEHIMQHCVRGLLADKTVIMAMHQMHMLNDFDMVMVVKEGSVAYKGEYSRSLMTSILPEFYANDELDESVRTHSVDTMDTKQEDADVEVTPRTKQAQAEAEVEHLTQQEQMHRLLGRIIRRPALSSWLSHAGFWWAVAGVALVFFTQTIRIISDWWISQWSNETFSYGMNTYIGIYGAFVAAFSIFLLGRGYLWYFVSLRAATSMHNTLFNRILHGAMSFFSIVPLGEVLNALSKDQDTLDEGMPDTVEMMLIYAAILATTLVLTCVVLPLYTVATVILVGVTILIMKHYISSALCLRELVNATVAHALSMPTESLRGIVVVRAFKAQKRFEEDATKLVNRSTTVMFHLDQLGLWLAFRLDFIASLLSFLTAILCVYNAGNGLKGSDAGLVISNSLQILVFYTWMMRGVAEAASQLSAVEREQFLCDNILQEKEGEADATTIRRPKPEATSGVEMLEHSQAKQWPYEGRIEFRNATMRYLPWMQPALDRVSIVIEPGHKVGICGRTGSGKSSLVMALYRMFPLNGGHLLIDGVDTATLSLGSLRRSLAIIPQEPVMFHGTIRSNLDPFNIHPDALLWEALEIANLKPFVQSQTDGLLAPVDPAGANFSVGQRQLICLARAFLIKSRILVLDEATAAMDLATDALIQTAIRTHFSERTVLTIAHRIDTIIHSDRILVMGAGQVLEYDPPQTLLANPSSAFYQLVHASG